MLTRGRIAWGAATAAPFAFLALPEQLSNAILGTWGVLAFLVGILTFALSGVVQFMQWWHVRSARVAAVETTLQEMGYAGTRNARQRMGGRRGRP